MFFLEISQSPTGGFSLRPKNNNAINNFLAHFEFKFENELKN